jgi:hypothetical protein
MFTMMRTTLLKSPSLIKQKAFYRSLNFNDKPMTVEFITREDLQLFRLQLLGDLKQLFGTSEIKMPKQWLKNSDVRKLLNVSSNTVQRLRISGKLKSSKVGGVHYYRLVDVERLLEGGFKS